MEIFSGFHLNFNNQRKVVYVSYLEANEDPNIINNMNSGTQKCIALGPTINIQGTHNLFSIKKRRLIKRWKIIPMVAPDQFTRKVNYRCKKREKYGKEIESININK